MHGVVECAAKMFTTSTYAVFEVKWQLVIPDVVLVKATKNVPSTMNFNFSITGFFPVYGVR